MPWRGPAAVEGRSLNNVLWLTYAGVAMATLNYSVPAVHCGHCKAAIESEVAEVPGVTRVEVDLPTGGLAVTSDEPVDDGAVCAAVEEAGYEVADR